MSKKIDTFIWKLIWHNNKPKFVLDNFDFKPLKSKARRAGKIKPIFKAYKDILTNNPKKVTHT